MIFGQKKQDRISLRPRWVVAWGEAAAGAKIEWREAMFGIAIFTDAWTFSPSGRFVILGDICLSNRQKLIMELDVAPDSRDIDLVARLWDKSILRLMALNIKFKGADRILTKVNNLTQAASLQGLSPLFDRRIVEMSMAIPPEYKLSEVQVNFIKK